MEVSALRHAGTAGIHGRSPLLRLQSDERLVTLTRRGSHGAYEALVARYQSRLHAFCRHMLSSNEDAEDVLQEVFAAAFTAMTADERPINVRPWLYRIARNRSLNHLRRVQPIGVDSMDIHFAEGGQTTADKVHKREEFRQLVGDVQELAETQRTALLLREIDALSYHQIAEAMDTTVPSVKSLLVRARVGLAEAAEARQLSCDEVRLELGEVAEGLAKLSPPVRRHLKTCARCGAFRKQLRETNKALAAVFPVGPLLLLKKTLLAHLGTSASAGGGAAATTGAAGAGGAAAGAASAGAGSALSAGFSAIATKAAAGIAAAALVTASAAEVRHAAVRQAPVQNVAAAPAAHAPAAVDAPQAPEKPEPKAALAKTDGRADSGAAKEPVATTITGATGATGAAPAPAAPGPSGTQTAGDTTVLTSGTQSDGDTTILPATQTTTGPTGPPPVPTAGTSPVQPPGGGAGATGPSAPAPPAAQPGPTEPPAPGPTGP